MIKTNREPRTVWANLGFSPLITARLKNLFKSGWDRQIIGAVNEPHALLEGKGWSTPHPHKLLSLSIAQCCKTFDRICVTGLSRLHLPQAFTVVLWQGHRHLVQVPGVSGSTAGGCKAPGNTIYHCHKANHPRQRAFPSAGTMTPIKQFHWPASETFDVPFVSFCFPCWRKIRWKQKKSRECWKSQLSCVTYSIPMGKDLREEFNG